MSDMTSDDLLAQLLELGFDIDVCRTALLHNRDVQSATEWILGQTCSSSSSNPVLRLGPEVLDSAAATAFSQQVTPPQQQQQQPGSAAEPQQVSSRHQYDDDEGRRMREESHKMSMQFRRDKQKNEEARQRALAQIKEDREKQKLVRGPSTSSIASFAARSTPTETSRDREKHFQEIKMQKQLDREARNRALGEIRQDHENRKLQNIQARTKTSVPSSSTAVPPAAPPQDQTERMGLVQFRLTDGSSVRQPFSSNTPLSQLYEFAREKEICIGKPFVNNETLALISAFPRRVFSEEDQELTVREAGFLPNVSLNVSRQLLQDVRHPEEGVAMVEEPTEAPASDIDLADNMLEEEAMEDEDEDMPDVLHNFPAINPHRPARPPHRGMLFGQRETTANPGWNWGVGGHRLVESNEGEAARESDEQQDPERDEAVNRQNALSAIKRRFDADDQQSRLPSQQPARSKVREIRSLRDTCAKSVSVLLTKPTVEAQSQLRNLMGASSKVGELLLLELMDTRKLERSSMKRLADHCYLRDVCLDSYVYATDSLLAELGMSNSSSVINRLSLKGCDVITDAGIQCLEGLKSLEYLDVSNCKVTDKGLGSLTRLSQLRSLNLSKTKVTDIGIKHLAANAQFKDLLETLHIDGCKGIKSSKTLAVLNRAFPELTSLGMASTSLGRQERIGEVRMGSLQLLDISHTELTDEDVIQTICSFKRLRELKLSGCNQISERGLGFIATELRSLEMIQFPSREHELDDVLSRYAELPLRHLDLTGFLQVTDVGVQWIARMKELQFLSLDGTKVTDVGVAKLAELTDLRKLYLDKTAVTDEGISELTGLTKLDTLSLSRTPITSKSLILLGDYERTGFTRNLRTLNLSQCQQVTDAGVRGLRGAINLTNLNLDHTGVSKQCAKVTEDFPHLKPVRLLGIEREDEEGEDGTV